MKTKQKLSVLALAISIGIVSESSQANTEYVQGTVLSDKVFYQIGGGSAVMPPPSRKRPNELSIGIGWKSNLTCGNFDIKTTIKNQLNGITEGFKDLYGNVIESATGAVASLPAMIIQRANPQLYDILSNGMYQAKLDFDSLKTSCEEMSNHLADYVMDSKWAKMAGLENYKEIASTETDAKKAKKKSEQEQGSKGITWIGGVKKGGMGQQAIDVIKDVVGAGFNMSLGRGVTEKGAINKSQCDGRLCTEWSTPAEAGEYARKILGSTILSTCTDCGTPTKSQAGTGLAPEIEIETIKTAQKLEEVLNVKQITAEQLNSLSSSTIAITRGLIESLREDPDASILGARLAQELAISKTVEKALVLRRMILAGMKEPNVLANSAAQEELEKALKLLDREIEQIKLEMELQNSISNNTAIAILDNRIVEQRRSLENNAPDGTNKFSNISKQYGSNNMDDSNYGYFAARDTYIVIPTPSGNGLTSINGSYASNVASSSTDVPPSLQAFASNNAYADGRATIYRTADGTLIKREGGSLAWRNNNPGNIRAGAFAQANGAIGVGPGGFAIFPDAETGAKAIKSLMKTNSYKDRSIADAIARYAPPTENDTEKYIQIVTRNTGLDRNTRMGALSDSQLEHVVRAIRTHEGWKEGNESSINTN
ncbi:integrating conjugative element protein [Glaesserella parasuis]|uniref:integrating conjugative element protein n=1 Tax=Glaesserella parasuis TaxID=738 RepID=UPI003CF841D4